jgi:predicted small lipoprotein YifL
MKNWFTALVAVFFMFAAFGCGDSTEPETTPDVVEVEESEDTEESDDTAEGEGEGEVTDATDNNDSTDAATEEEE